MKLGILYELPERSYSATAYSIFFGVGILVMIVALLTLAKIGYWIAKRRWFSKLVESQKPLYPDAKFILEHDGWREDQWEKRAELNDKEKYVAANLETACKYLNQIEYLFDCPAGYLESRERIRQLARYFQD